MTLPDIPNDVYQQWQAQQFNDDASNQIDSLGFESAANAQIATLQPPTRDDWAQPPPPPPPPPPPSEQPSPPPPPQPQPDISPPVAASAPPPTPDAGVSAPAPPQQDLPPPTAPVTAPLQAPPQAPPPAAPTSPFADALNAAVGSGADAEKFAQDFGSSMASATGDMFSNALTAVANAGGDVQQFASNFTPPTPPTAPSGPLPNPPQGQSVPPGGDLQAYARQAAQNAGVDPDVFVRQIQQESGFNPAAKSPAGAQGIAQIVPQYHPGVDPSDPYASLDYAAQLDAQNLAKYQGDYPKALAAYNAGGGAVDKYGGVPPFAETQKYVNTILNGQNPPPSIGESLGRIGAYAQQGSGMDFPVVGYQGDINDHWGSVKGGSDIMAERGTPVVAMEGGKVLEAGYNSVGGNSVLIQGADGNQYYYAHFDKPPSVQVGDVVPSGTYLGPVGNTGDAAGGPTHLHIGIGPSILLGADKYGGTGGDYNAVGLLQKVLADSQNAQQQPQSAAGPADMAPPPASSALDAIRNSVGGAFSALGTGVQSVLGGGQQEQQAPAVPASSVSDISGPLTVPAVPAVPSGTPGGPPQYTDFGQANALAASPQDLRTGIQQTLGDIGSILPNEVSPPGTDPNAPYTQPAGVLTPPDPATPLGKVVQGTPIYDLSPPDQAQALMQWNQMYEQARAKATEDLTGNLPVVSGLASFATDPEQILALAAGGALGEAVPALAGTGLGATAAREAITGALSGGVYGAGQPSATASDIALNAALGGALGGGIGAAGQLAGPTLRAVGTQILQGLDRLSPPATAYASTALAPLLRTSIGEGGLGTPIYDYAEGSPEAQVRQILQDAATNSPYGDGIAHLNSDQMAQLPGLPDPNATAMSPKTKEMVPGALVGTPTDLDGLRAAVDNGWNQAQWYSNFAQGVADTVGAQNIPEFASLFGITSRNTVENNLAYTLGLMRMAREFQSNGTPFNLDTISNWVAQQGKAGGGAEDWALTKDMLGKVAQLYNNGTVNIATSAKSPSYAQNVISALQNTFDPNSTLDTWMWRLFGYRNAGQSPGPAGSDTAYRGARAVWDHLAGELGVTPKQAQAAGWFSLKAPWDLVYPPVTGRGGALQAAPEGLKSAMDAFRAGTGSIQDVIREGRAAGVYDNPAGTWDQMTRSPKVADQLSQLKGVIDQPAPEAAARANLSYPGQGRKSMLFPINPASSAARQMVAEQQAPAVSAVIGSDAMQALGYDPARQQFTALGNMPHIVQSSGDQVHVLVPGGNVDALQYAGAVVGQTAGADGMEVHLFRPEGSQLAGWRIVDGTGAPPSGNVLDGLRQSLGDQNLQFTEGPGGIIRVHAPTTLDAGYVTRLGDVLQQSGLNTTDLNGVASHVPADAFQSIIDRFGDRFGGGAGTLEEVLAGQGAAGRPGLSDGGRSLGGQVLDAAGRLRPLGATADLSGLTGEDLLNSIRSATPEEARAAVGGAWDPAGRVVRAAGPAYESVIPEAFTKEENQDPVGVLQRLRGAWDAVDRQLFTRGVDLANMQGEYQKAIGRPLNADEMAYELSRRDPNMAAEVTRNQGLKPAVQSVGSDYNALRDALTLRSNVQVADGVGQDLMRELADQQVPVSLREAHANAQTSLRMRQQNLDQLLNASVQEPDRIAAARRSVAAAQRTLNNREAAVNTARQAVLDNASQKGAEAAAARMFSGGITKDESIARMAQLENQLGPTRFARVNAAAVQVSNFGRTLRQRLVESGVLSQEQADEMNNKYPDWVKTRILAYHEDPATGYGGGGGRIGLASRDVHAYTRAGTDMAREDPIASMVGYGQQVERMAQKNETFNALRTIDEASPNPQLREVPLDYSPKSSETTVNGFVNGDKKKYVTENRALAAAIEGANGSTVPKVLRMWNGAFRALAASRNPAFVAGHASFVIPSYILRATSLEGGPQALPRVLSELARGFGDVFDGYIQGRPLTEAGQATQRYLQQGGGQFGALSSSVQDAEKAVQQMRGIPINSAAGLRGVLKDVATAKPIEDFINRVDTAPRVAAMRLAERRGMNPVAATIAGRDSTIDFNQGGQFTKTISQMIPFFNVGFQGPAQVARTFGQNKAGFIATAGSLIGMPTLAAEVWNNRDPQTARDYADVPQYIKDQGLVFMLPGEAPTDAQGNRQPQFLWVNLRNWAPMAVLARNAVDTALGYDHQGLGNMVGSMAAGASPISSTGPADLMSKFNIAPGISAAGQLAINRDLFRNRYIVSARGDENASQLAKDLTPALQQVADRVSPQSTVRPSAVDFALRDQLAGSGGALMSAYDMLRGAPPKGPGALGPQGIPVLGGLIGRFVRGQGGQTLQSAQDATLTPSAAQMLREGGVSYTPTPEPSTVNSVPLKRDEQAQLQQLSNRYVDNHLQALMRSQRWANATPAQRDKMVKSSAQTGRDQATTEIMRQIGAPEIARRRAAARSAA